MAVNPGLLASGAERRIAGLATATSLRSLGGWSRFVFDDSAVKKVDSGAGLRVIRRDPASKKWPHAMKLKAIARDPCPVELFASSPSEIQDINWDIAHQVFEHVILRLEVHQVWSGEVSPAPIVRTRQIVNKKERISVGTYVSVWLQEYGIDGAEHLLWACQCLGQASTRRLP